MASSKYLLDMPKEVAEELDNVVQLLNEKNAPFRCSKKDLIVSAIKRYIVDAKEDDLKIEVMLSRAQ